WEQDWAEARERLGDAATVNDLGRTAPQRRHDAMVEMARASKAHGGAGAEPTLGTAIIIDHDPYLTALARILAEANGEDPNQFPYAMQRRCGFADGILVTPEQAVWASISGWIQTMAVDEDGFPLNLGRERRIASDAQRRAATMLFETCDHPSCR